MLEDFQEPMNQENESNSADSPLSQDMAHLHGRFREANVRIFAQPRNTAETLRHSTGDAFEEEREGGLNDDEMLDLDRQMEEERDQAPDGRGSWTVFRSRKRETNRLSIRGGGGVYSTDTDWTYRSNTPSTDDDMKPTTAFLYSVEPAPTGSDAWPDLRDFSKVPAKIIPADLQKTKRTKLTAKSKMTLAGNVMQASSSQVATGTRGATLTWPMNELPVELYYLVTDNLARDDIKAMRLTCHEFEHHISSVLFKTVVVPFNTEIYGMLQGTPHKVDIKGKGKMKADPSALGFWKNASAEDIYTGHGIDVFRTFGPRMKRFGMSFEVDEDALAKPPLKGSREAHKSYWGVYTWPYPEYHRFEQVAGLEDAADETPRMKYAFSVLESVQELALSLDSGLGWLAGPDVSLHSRVLRKPAAVFGTIPKIQDRKQQAQMDFWHHLKTRSSLPGGCDLRQATFHYREMTANQVEFQTMKNNFTKLDADLGTHCIDLRQLIDPTVSSVRMLNDDIVAPDEIYGASSTPLISPVASTSDQEVEHAYNTSPFSGGMLMVKEDTSDHDRFDSYPIIPNNLSEMQKEWLLETEWAQRAFLSSYLLAIVDNRNTFYNVHTINFSRLSSRYLLSLARNDFWNALPSLKSVNLQVIADWRDVVKDNAGFVETPRITLGAAQSWFYRLLFYMIVPRRNITALNIGWACGGEHAQGLHARNKQLMPAPFLSSDWMSSPENMVNKELMAQGMIDMRYLEELTLTNCWLPPNALVAVVTRNEKLSKLVLDSVSLSAPLTMFNGHAINALPVPVGAPPNLVQATANAQHQHHTQMQQVLNAQHNLQQAHAQLHLHNSQAQVPQAQLQALHAQQAQLQALQVQQAQLQAQHAQHMIALHINHPNNAANGGIGMNAQAFNPGPPMPPPQAVPTRSWIGEHRVGSWPHVIDTISPGATLRIHGCNSSPPNVVITNTASKLKTLEFRSCGYCRLNASRFDESAISQPSANGGTEWFTKRYQSLNKVMMKDKYNWIADIVQHIPQHEEEALQNGWGMKLGWENAEAAEGPTFDACLPGGTGRFSGSVTIDSRAPVEEDGSSE